MEAIYNEDYRNGIKNGFEDALDGREMMLRPIIDCSLGGKPFDYYAAFSYNSGYRIGYEEGTKVREANELLH